jgi:hypothetical protein
MAQTLVFLRWQVSELFRQYPPGSAVHTLCVEVNNRKHAGQQYSIAERKLKGDSTVS